MDGGDRRPVKATSSKREGSGSGPELVSSRSPPSNRPSRGASASGSDLGLHLPSVSGITRAQKNWQIARRVVASPRTATLALTRVVPRRRSQLVLNAARRFRSAPEQAVLTQKENAEVRPTRTQAAPRG